MTQRGKGFTILEILIFIAASSFLFISAMAAISGRQQQVQFSQSVREFDGKINDVINDVATGYFPVGDEVGCSVEASNDSRPTIFASSDKELGTNNDCLHVGKAIHFSPDGEDNKFDIYTLAGRKLTSAGVPVKSITDTQPVAVTNIGADDPFNDSVENSAVRFGIKITKVFSVDSNSTTQDYGIIAMLSNFEGSRPSTASVSDSQATRVGGIVSGHSTQDILRLSSADAVDLINVVNESTGSQQGFFDAGVSSGIIICLEDNDGRIASITIGAAGGSRTILQIGEHHPDCEVA